MSASLDATVAVVKAKKLRFKLERSPYTGQMGVYVRNDSVAIVPNSVNIDPPTLVSKINADLSSNSVDAYADQYVGFIGTALSKTYYPTVWVNSTTTVRGELVPLDVNGKPLIAPIVVAIVLAAVAVIAVTVAYSAMWYFDNSWTYYDPATQQYNTVVGTSNFLTTLNSKYWLVCPKDGNYAGSKAQYPTLAQYQASPNYAQEFAWWKDHCESAQNLIGAHLDKFLNQIMLAVIVIGGVYVAIKVLPSVLSKKKGS